MTAGGAIVQAIAAGHARLAAAAGAPAWLQRLRQEALASFQKQGWPTPRQEEWRSTRLDALAAGGLSWLEAAGGPGAAADGGDGDGLRKAIASHLLFEPSVTRLVFIDGRFAPDYSAQPSLPPGVQAGSLAAALAAPSAELREHFSQRRLLRQNPFWALNSAFLGDGAWLRLADGAFLERPIHLIFVSSGDPAASHPRVCIQAGRQSRAVVVETYAGPPGSRYLSNALSEVQLADGAALDHYRVQEESRAAFHLGGLDVRLRRNARFQSHNLSMGAALARVEVRVAFEEPGGECQLNGLYVVSDHQHVDHQLYVEHGVPHCTSRQNYRGVLDQHARGVFHGRVLVKPGAQGSNASQSNKNLLLSRTALADSQPQLEIHADDVKCSHGVTIGQLDEGAIFYLRSRGIALPAARAMLTQAFAGTITEQIRVPALRCRLDRTLAVQLGGEAGAAVAEPVVGLGEPA